ncbi:uncharacterized protein TrAtP1_010764 [Trichoderma atroviride]|uniref:uncharacterized protein n=1 Tax=Hypocrea atroviridis TaxID=63577 RepID=UPI0033166BB4|nr:hypothetical protein TrAtP1_010764 [Trichoderma atroviride]
MSSTAPLSTQETETKVSDAETQVNQQATAPAPVVQPWKGYVQIKAPEAINFAGDTGNIRLIDGRVDGKVVGG